MSIQNSDKKWGAEPGAVEFSPKSKAASAAKEEDVAEEASEIGRKVGEGSSATPPADSIVGEHEETEVQVELVPDKLSGKMIHLRKEPGSKKSA